MINFDNYSNENKTEHNTKWPYIPDHRYKILIIRGCQSGKTYICILKIHMKQKYQYLINKRQKVGLDHFNDSKAFMEYSNDMLDAHKHIEDYNPDEKRKV